MDERGKLDFSDNSVTDTNEELSAMKDHWSSFLDNETDGRDKYLRALEIEFSLETMAEGELDSMIDEGVAKVFSERKHEERKTDARVQKKALKDLFK